MSLACLGWICGTRLQEHRAMVCPFVSVGRGTWCHPATHRERARYPTSPFHCHFISFHPWTCGFWLMEWKASKKMKLVTLHCIGILVVFLGLQKGPNLVSGKISNGWNKTGYIFSLKHHHLNITRLHNNMPEAWFSKAPQVHSTLSEKSYSEISSWLTKS